MDIKAFKKALKAGEVAFSYKKKDGTIREALGTLCETMIPKSAPVVKFKCKNINWDTEGRGQCGLPDKVTIELDEAYVNELADSALEEQLAGELTDKYGFSVLDYEYERVEKRTPKKLPGDSVFYYDLQKSGFRSFNESQLISWRV